MNHVAKNNSAGKEKNDLALSGSSLFRSLVTGQMISTIDDSQ